MLDLTTPFWSNVAVSDPDDCWEWQRGRDRDGYGTLRSSEGVERAARVALGIASGKMPDDLHALHSCDNPPCCNPRHLRWGTPAENMADKLKRGRARTSDQSGANNGAAKLTEDQVALIVERLKAGWNNTRIAADLPVTHSMVSLIRLGRMWRPTTERLGWTPPAERQAA